MHGKQAVWRPTPTCSHHHSRDDTHVFCLSVIAISRLLTSRSQVLQGAVSRSPTLLAQWNRWLPSLCTFNSCTLGQDLWRENLWQTVALSTRQNNEDVHFSSWSNQCRIEGNCNRPISWDALVMAFILILSGCMFYADDIAVLSYQKLHDFVTLQCIEVRVMY